MKKNIDVADKCPDFPMRTKGRMRPISIEGKRKEGMYQRTAVRFKRSVVEAIMITGKHKVNTGKGRGHSKVNEKGWIILGPYNNTFYLSDEQFNEYFDIV